MNQTFSVGKNPRVIITQGRGNVTIRSWEQQSVSVETEGPVEQLYQEGDSIFITGCATDLTLTVPYMKSGWGWLSKLATDISVHNQTGRVSIENAGDVELVNITEPVELSKVEGNLRGANLPTLYERRGVGGNVTLTTISRVEIGAVGGNLYLTKIELAKTGAVGGNLDADQIAASLECGAVGGNCQVQHSPNAEIAVNNVGGSFQTDGVARIQSCNVGGNLNARVTFQAASSSHIIVGGNASIALPENANVSIRGMVGGSVSGEALGTRKVGNFLNITYGDGSSTLNLTVGGSLVLLGNNTPSEASNSSFPPFGDMSEFGREMGRFGREMGKMGRDIASVVVDTFASMSDKAAQDRPRQSSTTHAQKREAILRMVAEGRITPEEGSMLLEALGE